MQLRYLVAIADNGLDTSVAAQCLSTSQPGIGRQLKLLEEELGTRLFVRNGRNLCRITPVGEDVVAHARAVMREVDAIRARAMHASSYGAGEC